LLWRIQPASESTPASIAAIKRVEASRTIAPDVHTFPDALLWDGIFRTIHSGLKKFLIKVLAPAGEDAFRRKSG
jgi:hypothetical protein